MNVLVIDDDPVIRSLIGDILRSLGHAVINAQSGAEGLQALAEGQAQIVILDYQLPDMSGLEVLRKARACPQNKSLPIILLSASDDRGLHSLARQAGADACLEKPFKLEEFVQALTSLSR